MTNVLNASMDTESLFLHAFKHAAIGMAIVALDGSFREVNPSMCRLTGYSERELLTMSFLDITHPDDAGYGERMRAKLVEGVQESYEKEKRYIRKDGVHIWVQLSVSVVRGEDGEARYFVTQLQDISHRKRAEHLLHTHLEKYKSLFEENPDLVYAVSLDGEITSINASVERLTGYSAEEWSGCMPVPLAEGMRQALHLANEGFVTPIRLEADIPHKNGGIVHLDATYVPILVDGEPVGVYGIAKDVTKQAELVRQLQDSERKYRLLAEHSLDTIARVNPFGVFTYVTPSSVSLLGYEPEELVDASVVDLIHPDDIPALHEEFRRNGSKTERRSVFRARTKAGDYVWIEARTKNVRSERSGRTIEFITVLRDVTERVQAEHELAASEERYRLLVEHSPDAILVSVDLRFVYVNETAVELFGAESKEQLLRIDPLTLVHPDYLEHGLERRRLVDEGRRVAELAESKYVRLDGSVIDVEVKSIPTLFGGAPAVHTILQDVTDRKQTQELMQLSGKLTAAGQLAAGIAHEIRNPLTSLKGFLRLIQRGAHDKPMYFRIMDEELHRVETILEELLLLAKPNVATMAEVPMGAVLGGVVSLLETQARLKNIEFAVRLPEEPMLVHGDKNHLKQVFINAVKNAVEAMPDGGRIAIEAEAADGNAEIRVTDEGIGIPPEHLALIGRPFFTTKEYGSGLGLNVSFTIVKQHGGTIHLESEPGQGTTLTVRLPLAPG